MKAGAGMGPGSGTDLADDPGPGGRWSRLSSKGWRLRRSKLTWKIVLFNLVALNILAAGILFFGAPREKLLEEHRRSIRLETRLIAEVLGARLASSGELDLAGLDLHAGELLAVLGRDGEVLAQRQTRPRGDDPAGTTGLTDGLRALGKGLGALWPNATAQTAPDPLAEARILMGDLAARGPQKTLSRETEGGVFTALAPILTGEGLAVAVSGPVSDGDAAFRAERERILRIFLVATVVSILLSFVLASTIAGPLAELVAAVELGVRNRGVRPVAPGRVRIPDLTRRGDEIGDLSGALRGMVDALYDRIDSNEQFAADVAHEVKNPLASLRSAVGALRLAKRADQQEKLLDVIDHDVRRLDRLVSDISNASRLDSELVREEEEEFDLLALVRQLGDHLGDQASERGIDLFTDLPKDAIRLRGLEPRLAQVFVNLVTNAISFCQKGDAIRVWVRRRENRVLLVVEDTGPGIPDEALSKIFTRFYSHRPEGDFGNNSGLGLAISKQIVEAHGGVIWAENIRPTDADVTSAPLGARFVVGLPL
ncbi:histidine kinase [Pseudooceanicola sp. HF7]|nr:histidine kinase [Pseudooceanicola sp. HF7]